MYKNKEKTEFYKHTFGICFECNSVAGSKRVIGYTSDTSLSVDDTFKENMMQKFETCDILIANISGIYEDDILLEKLFLYLQYILQNSIYIYNLHYLLPHGNVNHLII